MRRRHSGYFLIYSSVYYLGDDLSWPQLLGAFAAATAFIVVLHLYLKKGDDEILKKVQASQDRYEYEQEKKALAATKKSKERLEPQDAD